MRLIRASGSKETGPSRSRFESVTSAASSSASIPPSVDAGAAVERQAGNGRRLRKEGAEPERSGGGDLELEPEVVERADREEGDARRRPQSGLRAGDRKNRRDELGRARERRGGVGSDLRPGIGGERAHGRGIKLPTRAQRERVAGVR